MYVNILTFKLDPNDRLGNELSMMDDNLNPKPKGLDRFHIFKDKKKKNKYYLIEYWNNEDSKIDMENSDKFNVLNHIHNIANQHKFKKIECDFII